MSRITLSKVNIGFKREKLVMLQFPLRKLGEILVFQEVFNQLVDEC